MACCYHRQWSSEPRPPLPGPPPLHDPCPFPSLSPFACRDPPLQRHDITHALSASKPRVTCACAFISYSRSNTHIDPFLRIHGTCTMMAVSRLFGLASLATTSLHVASASAAQLQQPLFDDAHQAALTSAKKPLVDSEALQDSISIDRLLKGAQDLYDIANLSSHEYNRPTRVIGSEGKNAPV